MAGAEPAVLQADITGDKEVDDNAFHVELATVVENSFNIHQDGPRLVFRDEENPQANLMARARAEMKAQEWSSQNPEYRKLHTKYQGELRDILKKRFDRFAVVHRWNFSDPTQCEFHVESLRAQGGLIPETIEEALINDL